MRSRWIVRCVAGVVACAAALAVACVPDYAFQGSAGEAGAPDSAGDGSGGPRDGGVDAASPPDGGGDASASDGPWPDVVDSGGALATSLAAGSANTCVIRQGTILCWGGQNQYGQLGAPPDAGAITRPRAVDKQALSFTNPDEVRVSKAEDGMSGFSCARASGAVYCWGYAAFDQRGDNDYSGNENGPTITTIPFLGAGALQIALGTYHACALTDTGDAGASASNVWCWGWSSTQARGPQDGLGGGHHVVGVPAMKYIAAGGDFTCGIAKATSEIYCWGDSWGWRAGLQPADAGAPVGNCDPSRAAECNPRKVVLPAGTAASLALSRAHACALTVDGAVYCWGANDVGELGHTIDPATSCTFPNQGLSTGQCTWLPAQPLASGVKTISAGLHHTCALMADKTAKCWGYNDNGQIGSGQGANASSPIAVVDPVNNLLSFGGLDAIAAGGDHTCALRGQELYCWGTPVFEGDGGKTSTPQRVPW